MKGQRMREHVPGLRTAARENGTRQVYVTTNPFGPLPTSHDIRRYTEGLRARGVTEVVTAALSEPEQEPFLEAGFVVHERLHLLTHDLTLLPRPPRAVLGGEPVRTHRARRSDRRPVLEIDARAFEPFWHLGPAGLRDALTATPVSRFRIAQAHGGGRVGYAIFGRSGSRGYVQRLAVDPVAQGEGVGLLLLLDGLYWMSRRGSRSATVNTQEHNERALSLYESVGFRAQSDGLAVLGWSVPVP